MHHDVSTATGEEVVLFTLAESPVFRDAKKNEQDTAMFRTPLRFSACVISGLCLWLAVFAHEAYPPSLAADLCSPAVEYTATHGSSKARPPTNVSRPTAGPELRRGKVLLPSSCAAPTRAFRREDRFR